MKKAIFFDRDGILNKSIIIDSKPYSPRTLKEFKIQKALAALLKVGRIRQDLNLRGGTPTDFKSVALTTRPSQLLIPKNSTYFSCKL